MTAVNRLIGANGHTPVVASLTVPNASGSASAAVTTAVSLVDKFNVGQLPAAYKVTATPSQPCFVSVTGKTQSGFNVVLTPLSGNAIAAGTFDLICYG